MPILIVAIMVFSGIAFAVFSRIDTGDKETINGLKFVKNKDNKWSVNIQKIPFTFYYNPNELQGINISVDENIMYYEYMLTSDPNATNVTEETYAIERAKYELKEQMEQKMGIPVTLAYTEEYKDVPVINCKDSTANIAVIRFSYENSTQIEQMGNCIKVEAEDALDMIKARDLLFYKILGVVQIKTRNATIADF